MRSHYDYRNRSKLIQDSDGQSRNLPIEVNLGKAYVKKDLFENIFNSSSWHIV
jgi:hypothetical protein